MAKNPPQRKPKGTGSLPNRAGVVGEAEKGIVGLPTGGSLNPLSKFCVCAHTYINIYLNEALGKKYIFPQSLSSCIGNISKTLGCSFKRHLEQTKE